MFLSLSTWRLLQNSGLEIQNRIIRPKILSLTTIPRLYAWFTSSTTTTTTTTTNPIKQKKNLQSPPKNNSTSKITNHLHQPNQIQLRHSYNSLSLPTSQAIRRGSPAPPANIVDNSSSSNYMEMCSPCGSSPGDPSGNSGYIPMSPSTDFPRG